MIRRSKVPQDWVMRNIPRAKVLTFIFTFYSGIVYICGRQLYEVVKYCRMSDGS